MEVSEMKRYVMILILLGALALPTVVLAQGEVLYGCTSDNPSVLYMLNPTTGGATLIGEMDVEWCTGLAFDSNGNLFAMGWDGGVPALWRVDPSTGASTFVGLSPHPWGQGIPDISFRSNDVLFAYLVHGDGDGLGTLNTATGAVTVIGNTGQTGGGNGIAFSPGDVLFHSNQQALFTLNQGTGFASLVAGLAFNFPQPYCPALGGRGPRINAMDFNSGGTLFGVLNCGYGDTPANYLVTIDTDDGDVYMMGPTVDRLDGIAFGPPPEPEFVPEWGSIALLGSGLLGLAGYAGLRFRKR
jgi:WD40 repeat protein